MIIDATTRFRCAHQFVGYAGFFRCAACAFRVSELPLTPAGASARNAVARSRPTPVVRLGPAPVVPLGGYRRRRTARRGTVPPTTAA